jgi:U4/U6 small nuclear ribonucleoprotein PRP31
LCNNFCCCCFLLHRVAIAARVDASQEHTDGSFGSKMYEEIVGKLEKISAPPPLKTVKPLPIPDSERKKRRGGKRARKLKELYAQTEMRKQKNRMAFGETAEVEVFVGDRMEGLGMLGAATGSGSLRANPTGSTTDTKLREHLKKQAQAKLSTSGSSGTKAMQIMQESGQISLQAPQLSADSSSSSNKTRYFNQNVGFKKVKE